MIAVLPQTGQRQRNASEVAAWPQSQFASECFMGWHSSCVERCVLALANSARLTK
jgi:hypothetical protein